jgi:hypothetical protein
MTPAAPAAPAAVKPFSIRIGAPCHAAFQEAVVHARNGYTFSDAPIELMQNGMAFFTMILGEANEYAIMKAKESTELSVAQEAAQYRRDVEEAAKRQLEQAKRAELEKQVAEAVAASERAIAKLKKDAAAELAKLS